MQATWRQRTIVLLALAMFGNPARAQVADHLKCYKLKDPLKLSAVADVVTPQFGLDGACTVSKAMLFCVPATKTNVTVTNKATGLPVAPLPLSTVAQPGDQICYKLKCSSPITPITDQAVTDQFGNRTLSRFKSSLVCIPAVKGTAYCGDGTLDPGEQCEPGNLAGQSCTSLGFRPGTLTCTPGCTLDTSGCPPYPPPGTCGNGTIEGGESCDGADLGGASCTSLGHALGGQLGCTAWCDYDTSGCVGTLPQTGQTTCWDMAGAVIPCAGTGQDGEVRAGAPPAFVDNGDGTITDPNTGLVWEKHSDDGSIHDKDTVYTWGNAFAVKLAALNTPPCFAGACDWRLPNRRELESIIDLERADPCVPPAFDTGCLPGCPASTCSCTTSSYFWSSTSVALQPISAWTVYFFDGGENFGFNKTSSVAFVRAVRGGS